MTGQYMAVYIPDRQDEDIDVLYLQADDEQDAHDQIVQKLAHDYGLDDDDDKLQGTLYIYNDDDDDHRHTTGKDKHGRPIKSGNALMITVKPELYKRINCDHCGRAYPEKDAITVKCEDDQGIGSMLICPACNEENGTLDLSKDWRENDGKHTQKLGD